MKSPVSTDQAHARATLAALTALVDLQEWTGLSDCFADRVRVDYTSLWGGEPQDVGRDELLGQWKGLLPGFDATMHELGAVEVSIDRNQAVARAPFSGTHILDGDAWIVSGWYEAMLIREPDRWRLSSLKYLNSREDGDRSLTERAKEIVGQALNV